MKKLLVVLPLLAVAGLVTWGILRRNTPPTVNFVRVKRQTLISTLPTNGKAEPIEWQAAHSETGGLVSSVPVQEGQSVKPGDILAIVTDPSLQAEINAAQARVEETQAALSALENGGRPAEVTEIENSLNRARFDLQKEQKELDTLKRLQQKQAATGSEVQAQADKVHQLELDIAGYDKRRGSLVAHTDVDVAKARVQDAQNALALARQRAALSVVKAPVGGQVYGLAVRPGAYLTAGDLVANVGRFDRLRVRVYVDEPLLGHVAVGQPVTIRWEALPGRQWNGSVDRRPVSIEALGSRQVGEVLCNIENPGRDLIPGTNVDAEIRIAAVDNAVVIPKETLHHDTAGDFVFARHGDTVERRPVKTGNSTATLVQIMDGLTENDAVALPGETPLKPGDRVNAEISGA